MDWYYESNGETIGPISESQLLELRQGNQIQDSTLVWSEGMENWTTFADARSRFSSLPPEATAAPAPTVLAPAPSINPYETPQSTIFPDADPPQEDSLGPFTLGNVLSGGFSLYRRTLPLAALLYLVVWIPLALLSSYADFHMFAEDTMEDLGQSIRFANLLDNFIGIIATGAIFQLLLISWSGDSGGFFEALGTGFRCWGRMFGARFISGLVFLLGIILLILPGIYVYFRLVFVPVCVVVEEAGPMEAFNRSWALTKGNFWRVFGYFLVASLIALIPFLGLMTVYMVAEFYPDLNNWIAFGLLDAGFSAIAVPFWFCFMFVFYQHLFAHEEIES